MNSPSSQHHATWLNATKNPPPLTLITASQWIFMSAGDQESAGCDAQRHVMMKASPSSPKVGGRRRKSRRKRLNLRLERQRFGNS